jgi:hypothetical protein
MVFGLTNAPSTF